MGSSTVRIVILGCAGSGKYTLARRLGEELRVPVICLDDIWMEDWGADVTPAFRVLLQQAHAADAWVSDGNFAAVTFDIRLPRATLIVWLERARLFCAWHAVLRVFGRNSGHRLRNLRRVLRFIRNFDAINRPRIEALRLRHGGEVPVRHLASDEEVEAFVAELRGLANAS
jgi:adenylate kinase family enzyme